MAEETVRVLRIEVGDSQKTVKGLRQQLSELRDTLLKLDKDSEEYAATVSEMVKIETELNSVMKATKTTTDAADGSYAQLQQRMKELRAEWRATGDDARRAELGKQIDEINTQLKEFDKTIGDSFRNVGNYSEGVKDAFRDIRNEIKQYRSDLLTLDEGSEEYNATLQKLADAQFKLRDMNEIASMSANDLGEKLNTVNRLAAGVASGFGAYRGIMALVGADTEKTDKAMVKLQATIAFVQGVQGLEGLNKTVLAARLQFKGWLSFIPKFIAGLHGIRAAVAATGLGALLVILGSIIGYWDEISKMWEGTPTTLNKVRNSVDAVNASIEQTGASAKLSEAGLDAYLQALKDGAKAADAMAAAERAINSERHSQLIMQRADLQKAYDEAKRQADEYQKIIDDINASSWTPQTSQQLVYYNNKLAATKELMQEVLIPLKRINVELSESSADAASEWTKKLEEQTEKAKDAAKKAAEDTKRAIEAEFGKDFDPEAQLKIIQKWYDLGLITAKQYAQGMKDYTKTADVLPEISGFKRDDVISALDDYQQEVASKLTFDPKILEETEQFGKAYAAVTKAWTEKDMQYRAAMFGYAADIAGNMSNILGEETAAGKAFAVAQAMIDTYSAGLQVFKDPTFVGQPWMRFAAMATTITAGLVQVKNILSVNTSGGPQSGSAGGGSSMPTPRFVAEPVTYTRNVQTDSEIEQARQTPVVKAYVVEKELTEKQREALAKKNNATF